MDPKHLKEQQEVSLFAIGKEDIIQASAFNLGAASIFVAEATTMRNGIRAALQVSFKNIHAEGDNKILI